MKYTKKEFMENIKTLTSPFEESPTLSAEQQRAIFQRLRDIGAQLKPGGAEVPVVSGVEPQERYLNE